MTAEEKEQIFFPLSARELTQIRKGRTVKKHYHLAQIGIPTLQVLVATFKHRQEDYRYLMRKGISVTSIALDETNLATIEQGDVTTASYQHFDIHILTTTTLSRIHQAKKTQTLRQCIPEEN